MIKAKNIWEQRMLVNTVTVKDADVELARVKARRDPSKRKADQLAFLEKLRASLEGRSSQ